MTDWNGFKGAAKKLEDVDIPRIASRIGVGEDEIHAFMDVEAAGSGFDSQRRPKMLFEPHVFYRNLSGAKRTRAVKEGLAYAKWGAKPYPKDSYPRLLKAMEIDETAALKSASWGLGQILGENHKMIGFSSPQVMVRAFMADEETHLEAIVEFLKSAGIDDDLRRHDWAAVARAYNGPGYAKHNYHGRMATAFAKWKKIKDTPWSPDDGGDDGVDQIVTSKPVLLSDKERLKAVQTRLIELGYFEVGKVDGLMGSKTRGALLAFKADNGLPLNADIDEATEAALMTAPKREVAPARANADETAIADYAAVKESNKVGLVAKVGGAVAAAGGLAETGILEQAENVVGLGGRVKGIISSVWDVVVPFWPIALFVTAFLIYLWVRSIKKEEVESYRKGETP